jgi:hypothetical protein
MGSGKTTESTATDPITAAAPSFPCLNAPKVGYGTPGDTAITSQDGLNCFAWQVFIGLNWQVDPNNPGHPDTNTTAAQFGTPGTAQTAVWQTYANAKTVMRPDGAKPLPWGSSPELPPACRGINAGTGARLMKASQASRMPGEFNLTAELAQAFPGDNPNWLADKDGNLVYYEILMGEDEYDYIVDNGLYDADTQASFLKARNNIDLPMGHGDTLGGLELKAAWLAVPDPSDPKWQSYKTMQALVYDQSTDTCTTKTMALVGLHIIHKTASQPQWVWATFEHVDNAPDTSAIGADGSVNGDYTFYDNNCSELPVPAGCKAKVVNGTPVTKSSCAANVSPAYYLDGTDDCPAYPVRVSRNFPIKDTTDNHVLSLNRAVKQLITQANPDSVYANYMLVNVLWSSAAVNDNEPPGNPPVTPLSTSGETPSLNTVPVANTMLETYAQGFNCLSCHAYASVPAAVAEQLDGTTYATDYSFIFGFATGGAAAEKH